MALLDANIIEQLKSYFDKIEDPTIQDTKIIEPNKEFIDNYNQKLNRNV